MTRNDPNESLSPDVSKLVDDCNTVIKLYGNFPRNIASEEMEYHLGSKWGKLIHNWYRENPNAKLMVNDGEDMALPVVDAYIAWATQQSSPSVSSPDA